MKTSVKIILLVVFCIAAIGGVLVFAKTQVTPPSNLDPVDQYALLLDKQTKDIDTISGYQDCKTEYLALDDKIKRFCAENVLSPESADKYSQKITNSYGKKLSDYGFGLFQQSVWNYENISNMLSMVDGLNARKLNNGEPAVNDEFKSAASKLHSIDNEYREALRLSKSTAFTSLGDASSKISRARTFASKEYLKNNSALVSALNALPGNLAKGHFNYVSGLVNSLGGYYNVSKDYYTNTLIPRVDNAINEYKKATVYGGTKPSISGLESRAGDLVTAAMNYYSE